MARFYAAGSARERAEASARSVTIIRRIGVRKFDTPNRKNLRKYFQFEARLSPLCLSLGAAERGIGRRTRASSSLFCAAKAAIYCGIYHRNRICGCLTHLPVTDARITKSRKCRSFCEDAIRMSPFAPFNQKRLGIGRWLTSFPKLRYS
jgi:hypothetical protein